MFPDRPEPVPYTPINVRDFAAAHGTASHLFGGPASTDEFVVELLTTVRDARVLPPWRTLLPCTHACPRTHTRT